MGTPVWRALIGLTEIELEGLRYVLAGDRTAEAQRLQDPGRGRPEATAGDQDHANSY